jgi:hypothetical protein
VVAGKAVNEAAKDVRVKVLRLAGDLLEVAEYDLELVVGTVRVKDVPLRHGFFCSRHRWMCLEWISGTKLPHHL